MLQNLRQFSSSLVFRILFILLLASFGFWGIGDLFRSSSFRGNHAARVGDVKIMAQTLQSVYREDLARLRRTLGQNFNPLQLAQLNLVRQNLERLIDAALIQMAARDSGLVIDDQAVAQTLAKDSSFFKAGGGFDRQKYRAILQANGLTEQQFAEMIQQNVTVRHLLGFLNDSAALPDIYEETLNRGANQIRTFESIHLSYDAFKDIPSPPEEILKAFYEKNAETLYKNPEYRTLSVVDVSLSTIAKTIDVSEDSLKQAYQDRQPEFLIPEKRDWIQVISSTQEESTHLKKVAEREKSDLKKAAKELRLDTIPLTNTDQKSLPETVGQVVFSTSLNTVSDPFETPLGWHVVQITKIHPSSRQSFEKVRETLLKEVQSSLAEKELYSRIDTLHDLIAGGTALEEALSKVSLPFQSFEPIDQQAHLKSGSDSPLKKREKLVETAFQTSSGTLSEPVQENNQESSLVFVSSIEPASIKPLDSVRQEVLTDWRHQESRHKVITLSENMKKTWKDAINGRDVAKANGGQYDLLSFSITQPPATIPSALLTTLFTAKKGDISVIPDERGIQLLKLQEIKSASKPIPENHEKALKAFHNDLIHQYGNALRQSYPVTYNIPVIEQIEMLDRTPSSP